MSNLSVRSASEAAIGIATLRTIASTPDESLRLDQMAIEMVGTDSEDARTIRSTVNTLAEREHAWIKDRATHATISPRVNDRREQELNSMQSVNEAALKTVLLASAFRSQDPSSINELQESYVKAFEGIDLFPMGIHGKESLHATFEKEVTLAAPESARTQVASMLAEAEKTYLSRHFDAVLSRYVEPADPGHDPSPSF